MKEYKSAVRIAKDIAERRTTPSEVIESTLSRIEKVNPKINAHNFTFYEEAIINAKKSEDKYFANNTRNSEQLFSICIKNNLSNIIFSFLEVYGSIYNEK